MGVIDSNGRLFGRINLVDAAAIMFVAVLIPVGYASYLLFRPSQPEIDSVTRVDLSVEERRIAGNLLTAKLKVKGSGFNPLLRARIGDAEALGFVFENPNSADVLVGLIPPGEHDLVLYDGVREVARLRGAVTLQSTAAPWVRAFGWLTGLDQEQAAQLSPGYASDPIAPNAFRVVAVRTLRPARARIGTSVVATDLLVPGRFDRRAEVMVRCDWRPAVACAINGADLAAAPIAVTLPGGVGFLIEEVGPPAEPRPATMHVQFGGPVSSRIRNGDRDRLAGARAAEVVGVSGGSSPIVTLRLAVDESRDGWRYRGRLVTPGAPFSLSTADYIVTGQVIGLDVAESEKKR